MPTNISRMQLSHNSNSLQRNKSKSETPNKDRFRTMTTPIKNQSVGTSVDVKDFIEVESNTDQENCIPKSRQQCILKHFTKQMEEEFKNQSIEVINPQTEKDNFQARIDDLKLQNDCLHDIQK